MPIPPDHLSADETLQLSRARRFGYITAQIYRGGVFSEADFIVYGVLQRLAIRGLLICTGLVDRPAMAYEFAVPQTAGRRAPVRQQQIAA